MSDLHDDVRRHHDGSIDFDFYRRRAARLRWAALREFRMQWVRPLVRPAVAVAIMIAALLSLPSAAQFERSARQPGASPAIAQVGPSAPAFRRAAGDLLGSARLRSPGERSLWPEPHP